MKNVFLIAPPSTDSGSVVRKAAALTGRGFTEIGNSRTAFAQLGKGLVEVDVVVVDAGHAIHPMAIIESIAACDNLPPVIVITDLEEEYMRTVVRHHGAAACLAKPFNAERLAAIIEKVAPENLPNQISCDVWGHPRKCNCAFQGQVA